MNDVRRPPERLDATYPIASESSRRVGPVRPSGLQIALATLDAELDVWARAMSPQEFAAVLDIAARIVERRRQAVPACWREAA